MATYTKMAIPIRASYVWKVEGNELKVDYVMVEMMMYLVGMKDKEMNSGGGRLLYA